MSSQKPAAAKSFSVRESNPPVPHDSLNKAKVEVAPVEILEELNHDEERDRHWLELRVEQAFYQAGKALCELRERRLYRSTHKTFEVYCRERFGFTHRHVNYLIAGSQVVENLQVGTMNLSH